MRRESRDVALRVHVDVPWDLIDQVAAGLVDVAVLYAPTPRPGLRIDLLLEEKLVFVTTDPSRDDEERLRTYLRGYDPTAVGLTGDLDDIKRLGESVGIFVADGEELASGGYDLGSHGSQVIALDGEGQAPAFWRQDVSAADLAADIELLLGDDS